jgi:biotin transport system substrate-specific component
MKKNLALIPLFIEAQVKNTTLYNVLSIIAGSLFLALVSQLVIVLPFSPVPITGQTFGVALLALNWGSKRAMAAFLLYLVEGAVGLPVFAMGKSGLIIGPTMGYLFGMWIASGVVGHLSDKGLANTFKKAFLCCVCGSLITFSAGLLVLSFFVPKESLLMMGLIPFLPGDLLKNLLASFLTSRLNVRFSKSSPSF